MDNSSKLPMPRALTETSANPIRSHVGMAPPSAEVPVKRKMQQPALPQPVPKAQKAALSGKSLQYLNGQATKVSGIARPASAASSRHGPTRSIDTGIAKKGAVTRQMTGGQPSRARPATSMAGCTVSKSETQADTSMNGKAARPRAQDSYMKNILKPSRERHVSDRSSVSSLNSRMSRLSLGLQQRLKTREEMNANVKHPCNSLKFTEDSSKLCQTPSKLRRRRNPVTPSCFLTIEQSSRVPPAFDIDSRMQDMSTMVKSLSDGMGSFMSDRDTWAQSMELQKQTVELQTRKIAELEALRSRLEENNNMLLRDLDTVKATLSSNSLEADEARRRHLNEMDDVRRKHLDEVDRVRRIHRDELDETRRESQRVREQAALSAKDDIEELARRHEAELTELRRELNYALEEEQRARKQDVRSLQDEASSVRKNAESGEERHLQELRDQHERYEHLARQLDREREHSDDLRKQLHRSGEQNLELENATRSLKAQVEFLKSDSQSQSQAFTDLEQQTANALKETEECKNQLRKEESIRRKLLNQIQDLKGNIRVFCRVRPPLASELSDEAQISFPDSDAESKGVEVLGQEEKSSLGKVTTKRHAYSFDRSFGPTAQNAEIFAELSELVAAVCGGSFNTCIFSYGQTGSGKTYTMASPDGMIARAVGQIFDTARDLVAKGWHYTITGSFVEVYNENINDLLGRPEEFDRKKHEIRHNAATLTTEITDVEDVTLESSDHFTSVLDRALRNRSIAATKANERSSRSHSVCILKLTGENEVTGERCRSTLNLVDLAGSERLAHSQATGNRLKETQNINKSLSCLADVIAALGEAKEGSHIPYRNSKLTYLLQNSLGGNSKTLMFVMISPLQEHLGETLSSLNFATKVNNTRIIRKQQPAQQKK